METISVNGVTVEISRKTIRARMYTTALHSLAFSVLDEIVEETGLSRAIINANCADFSALAPRVKVVKGKLDFKFPLHTDTAEQFKIQLYKWLDSEHLTLIDKIIEIVNALDRVQDVDLLPGLELADTPKNKKK